MLSKKKRWLNILLKIEISSDESDYENSDEEISDGQNSGKESNFQ